MGKQQNTVVPETPVVEPVNEVSMGEADWLLANEEDGTPEVPEARSVVPRVFKDKYRAQAEAQGRKTKADKRSNGDWLARELIAECVQDGKTFDLQRFLAILSANGVDPGRWPSRTKGWEGRLRMSGAIVLRGIVGKTGVFRTPENETDIRLLAEQGDGVAMEFTTKWQ